MSLSWGRFGDKHPGKRGRESPELNQVELWFSKIERDLVVRLASARHSVPRGARSRVGTGAEHLAKIPPRGAFRFVDPDLISSCGLIHDQGFGEAAASAYKTVSSVCPRALRCCAFAGRERARPAETLASASGTRSVASGHSSAPARSLHGCGIRTAPSRRAESAAHR